MSAAPGHKSGSLFHEGNGFDDDGRHGHVLIDPVGGSLGGLDLLHDIGALDDFAEDRIADAVAGLVGRVTEGLHLAVRAVGFRAQGADVRCRVFGLFAQAAGVGGCRPGFGSRVFRRSLIS